MAAYPALTEGPSYESKEETLDDLEIDRATNGAPRGRALYTAAKKKFTVVHERCSNADKATMTSFYGTNRLLTITFVWAADGLTYNCIFGKPCPQYDPMVGARWKITTTLLEV